MRRSLGSAISKQVARFRAKRAVAVGLFSQYDRSAIEAISQRWPGHQYQKYFERMDHSFVRNAERVFALHLHRSERLRILDIGCGFGYFIHAAKSFGHHAVGVDLDDQFFNEVTAFVGIEKVLHTIAPFEPLPDVRGGPFDLITAFATCFDSAGLEGQWGVPGWRYFLADLTRFMSERCDIYVKFNQYVGGGARSGRDCQPVPDDLMDCFRSLGATFDKRGMWIRHAHLLAHAIPQSASVAGA